MMTALTESPRKREKTNPKGIYMVLKFIIFVDVFDQELGFECLFLFT